MQCSGRFTTYDRVDREIKKKATPMAYVCMLSLPVSLSFLKIHSSIRPLSCPFHSRKQSKGQGSTLLQPYKENSRQESSTAAKRVLTSGPNSGGTAALWAWCPLLRASNLGTAQSHTRPSSFVHGSLCVVLAVSLSRRWGHSRVAFTRTRLGSWLLSLVPASHRRCPPLPSPLQLQSPTRNNLRHLPRAAATSPIPFSFPPQAQHRAARWRRS